MFAYSLKAKVERGGEVHLVELPFGAGEEIDVILIRSKPGESAEMPLRGTPVRYERPTDPVGVDDWDALR